MSVLPLAEKAGAARALCSRGLMPELSSVKRFRAKCAVDRQSPFGRFLSQTHCLYPIQIIREQVQNIVFGGNTDKGVFIGFLFPSRQKCGSRSMI